MRILFTGGGTGGHLYPIIAVAQELKRLAKIEKIVELELFFAGSVFLGKEQLEKEGIVIVPIVTGKWRRYFSLQNFIDLLKIPIGILQAFWRVFFIMPDLVFSKGGYGALPVILAAVIFRIPIVLHDSDAVPGRVNRFSSYFVKHIGIAFKGAEDYFPKEKTAYVGVPLRKDIFGGDMEKARRALGIETNIPVIGIMGGSQGAQKINETVFEALKELTVNFEVIHQTGKDNFEDAKTQASIILEKDHKDHYHPLAFLDDSMLRNFYLTSDLIVSRAGASSIYEIAAWGKPSILIPIEKSAQNHQLKNAFEYATGGTAIVIEEPNLTPHILLAEIKKIIGNPVLMKKMKEAAQEFARIDSAEIVAREILKLGLHS